MFVGQANNHAVHACGQCGGVWLDIDTSERVIEASCDATMKLAESAAQSVREPASIQSSQHALACPVCQGVMHTERVEKAWLDIDICAAHGTWYDAGELQRVARTKHMQVQDWRQMPAPQDAKLSDKSGEAIEEVPTSGRRWQDVVVDFGGDVIAELPVILVGLFFEALLGGD